MRIIGTGSALPKLVIKNDELAEFLDTSDEWIRTRTGIEERRLLSDETLEELAVQAAKNALQDAGIEASDLDFILCSNVMGSYITPALSCILQGEIKADCPCLDINGACAGFIYALDMAHAYLKSGKAKTILIVCAEAVSHMVDWADRSTCVLFGDGAGAVVVTKGDLFFRRLGTRSNKELLYSRQKPGNCPFTQNPIPATPMYMNGQEVYKFAVSASSEDLRAIMQEAGLQAEDIRYYLLHQANMRIINAIRLRLHQPIDKFPYNMNKLGNTSSASIPILLDELNKKNALQSGDILAMSAFGAGLVTGSCILQWNR